MGRNPITLDLHVLSTPPTFVLSQDQTRQLNSARRRLASPADVFLVCCFPTSSGKIPHPEGQGSTWKSSTAASHLSARTLSLRLPHIFFSLHATHRSVSTPARRALLLSPGFQRTTLPMDPVGPGGAGGSFPNPLSPWEREDIFFRPRVNPRARTLCAFFSGPRISVRFSYGTSAGWRD